ncbi:unnamed protein product [Didymodactylos carnosus]|nr:unnamed protein product [Didymodactylos carnosus]CAF4003482.1 unnamed protein product [Didymodactylos carnosus]
MIIPFLPRGAHTIVMDYFVSKYDHPSFGFKLNQSASMEGAFLNHITHVQKLYYQIYNENDYVFDFPNKTNTRDVASIIINMTRLQLLIDKALEDMQP